MASIIMPAYNEASVICRSLHAVISQAEPDDEIFVCVNGCTDNTEQLAKTFGPRVTVLSTPCASKTRALNMGDKAATSFPHIYIDADVELNNGCLKLLKKALTSGRFLAGAPKPMMDLSRSSWPVRAYYDIWLALPYCRQGMIGAGVYAISEEGRARFEQFPDLIADDGYIRALFKEHERCQVAGAYVIVRAPATLKSLVKIKTRSRMGQMQLSKVYPELKPNERKAYGRGIFSVTRSPLRWAAGAVYLWVSLITRVIGRHKLIHLSAYQWEKDHSSRANINEKHV
ncbi:glycosyltransferase [Marinobacter salicampi]|uniref:glycosyltransferase n=1 Tax=Marinobacter salicampi TaxID=435907 RepID=UPI00140B5BE5|nr:glycosyltransferase family 2 protein [Marinobacter salicampi]